MTDLSVVVTAHSETTVAGPTMRSAEAAIEAARESGLSVQPIIGLDRATPATTSYFQHERFAGWERREYDEGDLGRVRNALVPETDGRLIAFLDADDLFSENWLIEAVRRVQRAAQVGERVIAHPELNVQFDGARAISRNIDSADPYFTGYLAYVRNYYDALCVCPREAHLEVPYASNELADGLGFEDWDFAIRTLEAGWHHVVVPDTIIFKRRRDESLLTMSQAGKLLVRKTSGMLIDRVRGLGAANRSS